MPTPSYPLIPKKSSFFSKIKRFFSCRPNDQQNLKIFSTDCKNEKFRWDAEKWLNKLPKSEHKEGKKILVHIAQIIGNDKIIIDLSKFKISCLPEKLIANWLPKLQSANFSGCKINDIKFLNKLKRLRYLNLNNCQLKEVKNIDLPKLELLHLANNQLHEFKNCHFPEVWSLNLENNKFPRISAIQKTFPKTRVLKINHDQIKNSKNIDFLILNKNLGSINLSNNKLYKPTILYCKNLPKRCKIYLNHSIQPIARKLRKIDHLVPIASRNRIINHLAAWEDPAPLTNNGIPSLVKTGAAIATALIIPWGRRQSSLG